MASARRVKRKHEARLMQIQGVVGVAIAQREGRDCIRVYVSDDSPAVLAALPQVLDEVPVEVVVAGRFTFR